MKNYVLFDTSVREALKPFTFTRPVSEIRCGIVTITEKWNRWLHTTCSFKTADYLQVKYSLQQTDDNVYINSSVFPTAEIVAAVEALPENSVLQAENVWIAARAANLEHEDDVAQLTTVPFSGTCKCLERIWHIFQFNPDEINADFELVTAGRDNTSIIIHQSSCFQCFLG